MQNSLLKSRFTAVLLEYYIYTNMIAETVKKHNKQLLSNYAVK